MTGDISYADFAATNAMLFNKTLLSDYGIEYPYDMVADGTWTFDEFNKLCLLYSDDLNSDGKLNIADDLFGYASSNRVGPYSAFYCTGERMLSIIDEAPVLSIYNEKTVEIFEKFNKLITSECTWKQMRLLMLEAHYVSFL